MPTKGAVLLIGAGGHARVVLDALHSLDGREVVVRDDAVSLSGTRILGVSVRSPVVWGEDGCDCFHVAIGGNATRRRFFEEGVRRGFCALTVIHPSAVVARSAHVAAGVFVAAGAIIGPGARIGEGAIVNHGSVVDHDCTIGAFSHLAPSTTLGGGVQVEGDVLLGAGATVLPGRRIVAGAVVGAGAVVNRDLQLAAKFVGVPAKLLPVK